MAYCYQNKEGSDRREYATIEIGLNVMDKGERSLVGKLCLNRRIGKEIIQTTIGKDLSPNSLKLDLICS